MPLGCPKDEHFSYFHSSCQLGLIQLLMEFLAKSTEKYFLSIFSAKSKYRPKIFHLSPLRNNQNWIDSISWLFTIVHRIKATHILNNCCLLIKGTLVCWINVVLLLFILETNHTNIQFFSSPSVSASCRTSGASKNRSYWSSVI